MIFQDIRSHGFGNRTVSRTLFVQEAHHHSDDAVAQFFIFLEDAVAIAINDINEVHFFMDITQLIDEVGLRGGRHAVFTAEFTFDVIHNGLPFAQLSGVVTEQRRQFSGFRILVEDAEEHGTDRCVAEDFPCSLCMR